MVHANRIIVNTTDLGGYIVMAEHDNGCRLMCDDLLSRREAIDLAERLRAELVPDYQRPLFAFTPDEIIAMREDAEERMYTDWRD